MVTATMITAALAALLAAFAVWSARRLERRWLVWLVGVVGSAVLISASAVLMWAVFTAAGDRSPRSLELSSGVSYERVALDEPRRQVMHVAVVDFDNSCVGIVTTRPGLDGLVAAETGTAFVDRTGAILSINVAFFYPFDEYPVWSSYPESGEVVTAIGPVVIDGQWLGNVDGGGDKGLALRAGVLSAGVIPADADFAVPGWSVLVSDGKVVTSGSQAYARAVAGVDLDTNSLVLVVSDGKQPGYAEGSTYTEMAEFLIARGVDEAVEFDGGGSATMAAIVDGRVELLSRPIHQRWPGQQRPVASHMGIMVDPDCP